jgi:hypothetical protein
MKVQDTQIIEGRYLLEERIPHDGPVELYRALDQQLERPVTVQLLSKQAAKNKALLADFVRHQQIAATIHHCSALAVYDGGEWDGRPFSVMSQDNGQAASSIYGAHGGLTDLGAALKITRQAAEALQCCRDAGLTDWVFAPEAVRIDREGDACLALIEGLGGPFSSATEKDDPAALGALLRQMVVGNTDPQATGTLVLALPAGIISLLDKLSSGKASGFSNAGEAAAAITELETKFQQPTEAYTPVQAPPAAQEVAPAPPPPPSRPARKAAEAHTMVADAMPVVPVPYEGLRGLPEELAPPTAPAEAVAVASSPYTPPQGQAVPVPEERRRFPVLLVAGVLLVLLLLAFAFSRFSTRNTPATAQGAESPPSSVMAAPDLRGKSLDDARSLAGQVGVNLAVGDPINSQDFLADTVAQQVPDPGTQIAPGSLITVSLSLGPPTPQPQPPAPQPPGKGKKDDHGKKDH